MDRGCSEEVPFKAQQPYRQYQEGEAGRGAHRPVDCAGQQPPSYARRTIDAFLGRLIRRRRNGFGAGDFVVPSAPAAVECRGCGGQEEDRDADDRDQKGKVESRPSGAGSGPSWSTTVVSADCSDSRQLLSDRLAPSGSQRDFVEEERRQEQADNGQVDEECQHPGLYRIFPISFGSIIIAAAF